VALLVMLGILWTILGIAARGGLVAGVNAAEEGSRPRLGELWGRGFGRFWSLLGVDILLALPVIFVVLMVAAGIAIPLVGSAMGGGAPGAEMIVPICGTLVLGVPVLIVLGFVLGIMHPIAVRYVMLGGQGAFTAAANSWRFLRARVKDSVLMWVISGALNLGAGIVIAIPFVVVGVGFGLPIVAAALAQNWGAVAGLAGALVVVFMLVSIAYTAVWGTFTSALWTLFFRQVAGMDTPVVQPRPEPQFETSPTQPVAESPAPPIAPPPHTLSDATGA
jgi:hypothetical protein